MTPQQSLAEIIDDRPLESLLVCGVLSSRIGRAWHDRHPQGHYTELSLSDPNADLPPAAGHDLALIDDVLDKLGHDDGMLLLGQLRNFGTHRIAVIVADTPGWQLNDFLGLGFQRQGHLQGTPERTLYTYNIDSYNRRRAWNNPQYWANPDMWDKARW